MGCEPMGVKSLTDAHECPYFFLDFLFSASTRAKVSMAASFGASV